MRLSRGLSIAAGLALSLTLAPVIAAERPIVAAASDLKFALEEVATLFRSSTGRDVRLVFGSSGNLFRQIEQEAPFEIFMSADEQLVFRLAAAQRTEGRGVPYALGRLVLFAPRGSPLVVEEGMDGLRTALDAGRVQRFAIANPEHAPYGRAAEQALRKAGLWELLQPKLVLGENVSQAAQFASGGSAQGGIFAYSLALSNSVSARGRYVLLPQDLHAPIRQRMALIRDAGATAQVFYRYLQEPAARAILRRYGFALPDTP